MCEYSHDNFDRIHAWVNVGTLARSAAGPRFMDLEAVDEEGNDEDDDEDSDAKSIDELIDNSCGKGIYRVRTNS